MQVILCRWIGYCSQGEYYAGWIGLPFPPYPGLGIVTHAGDVPDPIDDVFVNQDGDVVCMMPRMDYPADEVTPDEWPVQLAHEARGLQPIGEKPCYSTGALHGRLERGRRDTP